MSVNVAAELDPPNEAYTSAHFSTHVSIDDNKITNLVIDSWRNNCAAFVSKDFGQTSCIIDGVPWGPTPTGRAQWQFITSRPYVILEEWKVEHHRGGFGGTIRSMKVNVRVEIGFKVTNFIKDGRKAVWRTYPEIEAEQRGQLFAAIQAVRGGRPAVRRESTVTYPDGYPKSA